MVENKPLPAYPAVVENATIAATGDILLHMPVLDSVNYGGEYDFSSIFSLVSEYYQEADLMFANLEVTLGGEDLGYSSYPMFNSPDSIVTALKNAGVDVCLTANNHAYDTGYSGMMRTLEVLDNNGLEHLGTRESDDESYIMTKLVNGIKLGFICYTYDTREYTEWAKSLNFNILSDEASTKVNSFNYEDLEAFYADVKQQIYYMNMLGVDAKVFFIHWGTEYTDYPVDVQEEIAQTLCELGVDVIIGGHPHVIQEFDTLVSSSGHETICLYSMGNELSNQRAELMDEDGNRGYTEDGLIFQVSFEKFNNGKVKISGVEIIPTWVQKDDWGYAIIGMPSNSDAWSWGANDTYAAIASYNRTLGRIGEEYLNYRLKKGQNNVNSMIE